MNGKKSENSRRVRHVNVYLTENFLKFLNNNFCRSLFRSFLELAEYQEKMVDASIYYKEAFGITPEKALENEEKLHQMEELVASLEAEVKRSLKEKKVSYLSEEYILS